MFNLKRQETGTIINFNELDNLAIVFTGNKSLIKKMQDLEKIYPNDISFNGWENDNQIGKWTFPKKWIKAKYSHKKSDPN